MKKVQFDKNIIEILSNWTKESKWTLRKSLLYRKSIHYIAQFFKTFYASNFIGNSAKKFHLFKLIITNLLENWSSSNFSSFPLEDTMARKTIARNTIPAPPAPATNFWSIAMFIEYGYLIKITFDISQTHVKIFVKIITLSNHTQCLFLYIKPWWNQF